MRLFSRLLMRLLGISRESSIPNSNATLDTDAEDVEHKLLDQQSLEYWLKADSTFLAPSSYYLEKEVALSKVLSVLQPFTNVLDIGCGDGRFTRIIASYAKCVSAVDVSPILIERAKLQSKADGVKNIEFQLGKTSDIAPEPPVQLVTCMGVTSCIIDDQCFLETINLIAYRTRLPGSRAITIDTLSTVEEQIMKCEGGYVAKYRNREAYKKCWEQSGFALESETVLLPDSERKLFNIMFVWRRCQT